jgi:predicted NAD/FAD-binding protein
MRIAVVGSGIAGLGSAWLLSQRHEVVLFEADDRLGGHTDTHAVEVGGRNLAIDTGFIVYNDLHYPLLARLFDVLGVASQPTTMSFSVHEERSGLQYNAGSLRGLFCQPRNLVDPRYWRLLADLRRFYREAPALLDEDGPGPTLGNYLETHAYSAAFRDAHLVPMASALWSSPSARILDFPAVHLVRFMANHHMLQVDGRPCWRVVSGGSRRYIDAMTRRWQVEVRTGCAVLGVQRTANDVRVTTCAGSETFDAIVLACHADDALAVLDDAGVRERSILRDLAFQDNEAVLHTDARLLPPNRRAWAAWNAHVSADAEAPCTVSYWMNALQSIDGPEPLIVTLNRTAAIDPAKVLRTCRYRHPVQTRASVAAQQRKSEIQGVAHTWFAGAYWGHGFHEDGLRSALDVARAFGIDGP